MLPGQEPRAQALPSGARPAKLLRSGLALAWLGIGLGCIKLGLDLLAAEPAPSWLTPGPAVLGSVALLLSTWGIVRGAKVQAAASVFVSALCAILVVPLAYYMLAAAVLVLVVLAMVNS